MILELDAKFFKFIAPIGKFFGFMPFVKVLTVKELENSLVSAGFNIDYDWQPGKGNTVFFVAKKEKSRNPSDS